ncbi:MAG: hypothetical protein L0Y58_05265 [Verrucomicrobia subdivision 3 bacterium]|nr:hypothetical protein [Limisphaerales bacterium]
MRTKTIKGPVKTVKLGFAVVKIYRTPTKGLESFTVTYYKGRDRTRETFSDLKRATERAQSIVNSLVNGELGVLELKGDDRLVYIRARDAIEPFGVPLDLAALEYAEAKKLLQGGGLVEAARFFHRHASKVTHKLTPDVVDELIRSKQAQGLSDVHIKDLKSRLTRFSDCFRCQIAAITPAQIHDFLTSLKLGAR